MSELTLALRKIGEGLVELADALEVPVAPAPKQPEQPEQEGWERDILRGEERRKAARDWIVAREGTFTANELGGALGIKGRAGAMDLCNWAVKRGIAEEAGVRKGGGGRPPKLFRYVPPKAVPPPRDKRKSNPANGSAAVVGTGKQRHPNKEVGKLIKRLRNQGFTVPSNADHPAVYTPDGDFITTLPTTPSDHRSLKNARAKLVQAGARL